jgi:hypothetical protein
MRRDALPKTPSWQSFWRRDARSDTHCGYNASSEKAASEECSVTVQERERETLWLASQLQQHLVQYGPEVSPSVLCDEFFFQCIKQTINNNAITNLSLVWKMFFIIATIFPATKDYYRWILCHIVRCMMDVTNERIAAVATFVFMRFQARYYIGIPLKLRGWKPVPEEFIDEIANGRTRRGVLLYEMIWCQRLTYR